MDIELFMNFEIHIKMFYFVFFATHQCIKLHNFTLTYLHQWHDSNLILIGLSSHILIKARVTSHFLDSCNMSICNKFQWEQRCVQFGGGGGGGGVVVVVSRIDGPHEALG